MNFKRKIFCALLCLMALIFAVSSEAAVSVKGKNLDNIEDIVSTATGSRSTLRKYSLGIFNYIEQGIRTELQPVKIISQDQSTEFALRQIKADGTAGTITFDGKFTNSYGSGHGNSGREAAVSTVTGKNGKAVLWVDYKHDYGNSKLLVYPQAAFITSKDSKFSISGETPKLELSVVANAKDGNDVTLTYMNSYMQNVKGGIFLPNDSKEYFALSFTKNTQAGKAQGTGSSSITPYCSPAVFIVGMEISGDKVTLSDTKLMIEQHMRQEYSPASIAVGDFTGTGTANEIAMTTADKDRIYLSVFRLANDNGTYSKTTVVEWEKVCSYTGQMNTGYVKDTHEFPVSETLAGDFDGDGKTEIAVVYKDDANDVGDTGGAAYGKINVSIYKWNNGSFKRENASTSYNYFDRSSWGGSSAERDYILGLRAARADFDGDGKDEIAVLLIAAYDYYSQDSGYYSTVTKIFPYLSRWYCDQGTITPKYDSGSLKGRGITEGSLKNSSGNILFGPSNGVFYYRNTRSYGTDIVKEGVALGPTYNYAQRAFSITAAPLTGTLGKMKTVDDIAVSWSGNSDWEAGEGRNQHVYVFKTNLSNGNFSSFGEAKQVFSSSNPLTKTAVVAADFIGEGVELETPTHLKLQGDRTYAAIIQTPPYHVDDIPVPWNNDEKALTNFTYAPALKSTYTHSKNSSKSQDVNFNMNVAVETISVADLKPASVAIMKKAAAFAVQKFTGIDAGAILNTLVDQVNTTKDEVDKSSRKTTMTDSIETSTHDRVLYYTTATHLWRYPIKEPVPSWLFTQPLEGDTGDLETDKFLTFSICDDPVIHTTAGLEDSAYQPLHEEGNLFSYPTNIAQNEGYVNKKLALTDQGSITYSPGSHTHTVNVTENASTKKNETKDVTYGMISMLLGTVKVMSGNASENSALGTRGYTANFTKTYSTTDTLTASFPNPTGDYANVTFTTDMQAYADEAGILTLGFAVNNFGSTAQLWTDSIYNKTPDPALYLPGRFFINGSNVSVRTNEASAAKIRGIRFYVPETAKYSGPALYAGEKYRIDVPIYNASFVAPSEPVEVSISYSKRGEKVVTPIETKSVTLGGWEQGKDSNKAMLHFDWTVPEDMSPGQKELYVYIDPDNKIKEIHEEWTTETPYGNNSGYFPFSVVSAVGINAGANNLKTDDFDVKINGMNMKDFIAYAAKASEPFDAECVITNRGENTLVLFNELNIIASDDEEIESFTGSLGVFNTGETGSFFFSVYPENWKKCRELEAVFYTENDAVSITASANGTETPIVENGIVQRKISKTFTRSKNVAVLWKIDTSKITASVSGITVAAASDLVEVSVDPLQKTYKKLINQLLCFIPCSTRPFLLIKLATHVWCNAPKASIPD